MGQRKTTSKTIIGKSIISVFTKSCQVLKIYFKNKKRKLIKIKNKKLIKKNLKLTKREIIRPALGFLGEAG